MKHDVSRALSAIVSVFWVDSQTNNVPAPADHALDPSVVKDLAEQNIVEVARELSCYDHEACKESAQTLMDGLTQSLVDLGKPFKYIGACAQFPACSVSASHFVHAVWKIRRDFAPTCVARSDVHVSAAATHCRKRVRSFWGLGSGYTAGRRCGARRPSASRGGALQGSGSRGWRLLHFHLRAVGHKYR